MRSNLERIRRNCGRVFLFALFTATVFSVSSIDSTANGGVLKNGVRVGDRTKMHIVKPPSRNARKRIRVPGSSSSGSALSAKPQHDWFWNALDPKGPGTEARYEEALNLMRDRRDQGNVIISAARVAEISDRWRSQITVAARKHNVSELLILAVITAESRGKPKAQSPKGAQGLMQLIPATAKRFGVSDSFDPTQNIDGGSAYLAFLLDRFENDPLLTLAGYNAGENAVDKHKGVPPYRETRDYIPIVFDAIAAAENLCLSAPEGPRRACLWREGDS